MERLVERLMQFLAEALGWRRALLVVQDEKGAVAWWMVPADQPLSIRVNTDDSLSVTLGHRDPGDALLAELETLLENRSAPHGARTGAQAPEAATGTAAASTS